MADTTYMGMFGTVDLLSDERPLDWRTGLFRRYPNGKAQLTALTALMPKKVTEDSKFNFWTKSFPRQGGTLTKIYTSASLAAAAEYDGQASPAAIGQTLFVKAAEGVIQHFRPGHTVLIRLSTNSGLDSIGECTDRVINGAKSYIAVRMLEADDNGGAVTLESADTVMVVGNANADGGEMPQALSYRPTKKSNACQSFRTPVEITGRTIATTNLRTGDPLLEQKREASEMHSVEMEKAFWNGAFFEGTGTNGKELTLTRGIARQIREDNPELCFDYRTIDNASFNSKTWAQAGYDFLEYIFEQIYRVGDEQKMCFLGSGALAGLNALARATGQFQLRPADRAFGIRVMEWINSFGVLDLKLHPLFSQEPTDRYKMIIIEPRHLTYRHMKGRDTHYVADRQANGIDGKQGEYMSDCGLEYHFTDGSAVIDGIGQTNTTVDG